MTNNNNENTQGNENMEQNITDLYHSQFFKYEKKINGDRHVSVKMYGLENSATEAQEKMARHFKMIKRKYFTAFGDFNTHEDFIQEYSYAFIEACYNLKHLEPMRVLENEPSLYNARLSFIREGINRVFVELATQSDLVVQTREGRKYIEVEIDKLSKPMDSDQEEGSTMEDYMTEVNKMFSNSNTEYNHFTQWVMENHTDVLTKTQDAVFIKLLECYAPLVDRTEETMEKRKKMFEEISIANTHIDRTFKAIKKRCVKKYNEVYGGKLSPLSEQSKKFHKVLNEYVELANGHSFTQQSKRREALTSIVAANYDTEDFEIIIIKDLSKDDVREIVRGVKGVEAISNKVLRKIGQNIEAYIAEFSPIDITPSEVEYDYKEDLFANVSKLPGVRGRINHNGDLVYKDEEDGNWKQFKN